MVVLRHLAFAVGAWALLAIPAGSAFAQAGAVDHLKCYKIKDPLQLQGVVDLNSPQFGLEPNCKIAKAILFCVPVTKTVKSAVNNATSPPTPITPLPVSGPNPGDRICYRITCQTPGPASQQVTDQFGTRTLNGLGNPPKFRPYIVCTPAVKGVPTTTSSTSTSSTSSTTSSTQICSMGAGGMCNGTCLNPNDMCILDSNGVCNCVPHCNSNQWPTCNGSCPTGFTCVGMAPPPVCFCQ